MTLHVFTDSELRTISSDHAVPLYHQLFQLLKQKIEAGEFAYGELLPSEADLGQLFGVSRITSKRALDELEDQGLVERKRGRGTQVNYRYEPKILRAPLNSMLDNLGVLGKETTVDVLQFGEVPANVFVASHLKLAIGALVVRAVRVRRMQGEAFAYYISHTIKMASRNGVEFTAKALKQHARIELFRALGVQLTEVDQHLSAQSADADVAAALEVSVGSALLSLTRIYMDRDHRPVDLLQGLYRPDRFQYHMRLSAQSQPLRGTQPLASTVSQPLAQTLAQTLAQGVEPTSERK